jgi:murein DD-endopeptidase MepM/ murein hydrolase activator NlpD
MAISRRTMLRSLAAAIPGGVLAFAARGVAGEEAGSLVAINFGSGGHAAIAEGETLLVEVKLPTAVRSVEGAFPIVITPSAATGTRLVEPQPLFFYPGPDGATWRTILSAPLDSGGQRGTMRIAARVRGGVREWTREYESLPGRYGSSRLRLSRETSAPPPALAERRRREFEANAALYRRRTPRLWVEAFSPAVSHASRGNFGLRRTVNGTLQYRHAGLDFPVPIGTPVRAMNAGIVAFSGEQWAPGRIVILDHGGGIFTRYLHLSERLVAEGDRVARGQTIGRSGDTGGQRTAPHLHVDTIVNGTPVHPRSLAETTARLCELERSTEDRRPTGVAAL